MNFFWTNIILSNKNEDQERLQSEGCEIGSDSSDSLTRLTGNDTNM